MQQRAMQQRGQVWPCEPQLRDDAGVSMAEPGDEQSRWQQPREHSHEGWVNVQVGGDLEEVRREC